MSKLIRSLELSELHTLVLCGDRGSFAAAGEELGVSRVAVAKRIDNLEALVDRPLLERSSRGVRLTGAGAQLCARARTMLHYSDDLDRFVGSLRSNGSGPSPSMSALLAVESSADRVTRGPEAQLAQIQLLFEHVFELSATGLLLSGLDDSIVRAVNDAFCRYVARPHEALVGKSTVNLGLWHSLDDRERMRTELLSRGYCKQLPVRARRPDGEVRHGEVSALVIDLAGERLAVASVVDLSEVRAADAARVEYDRWRAVAEFGASVAGSVECEPLDLALSLMVGPLDYSAAAVLKSGDGPVAVLAQAGEDVDWARAELPVLDGGTQALMPKVLKSLSADWGAAAPIGGGRLLIGVCADSLHRDPDRLDILARIAGAALSAGRLARKD